MKVLAWYTFILIMFSVIATICRKGIVETEYTGEFKRLALIVYTPIIIFFIKYIF